MGLWVICPECGPLVALLPQRGAFFASIKCSGCGLKIDHEEVLPTAAHHIVQEPTTSCTPEYNTGGQCLDNE